MQLFDLDCKRYVLLHRRLHVDHAMHATGHVHQGAAAVARLDRHGKLQEFLPVDLPQRRDNAADDTISQAPRIPHRHHRRALLDAPRLRQFQRLKWPVRLGDTNHSQIDRLIESMDRHRFQLLAIR